MSRRGIMLAYPFEEKRLSKWKPPYICQPKYDGERCRAIPIGEGKYMLLSSQENPFFSVPHIVEDLSKLGTDVEFDGELYCHGKSFEDIHSIVSRTVNLHWNYGAIKFHVFDYIDNEPQMFRTIYLTQLVPQNSNLSITRAPFYLCETLEDIMRTYEKMIEMGYEGIIVRHLEASYIRKRSIYMMKFKGKKEDEYKIVGCKEEISIDGFPKERMGALVCEDEEGNQFSVGSGMTDESRYNLWIQRDSIVGKKVKVKYQHLTAKRKVPRFPIFLDIV